VNESNKMPKPIKRRFG